MKYTLISPNNGSRQKTITRIAVILALIILNTASFYYYCVRKRAWEKEKKIFELELACQQEKYIDLLSQLKEYEIRNESLSQEISLLQKEKQDLAQEMERLRTPEYLADIVSDRIRLKLEANEFEEKIRIRDRALSSLMKEREKLEAFLGQEKGLSDKLSSSSQKTPLLERINRDIDRLEKSQLLLKDKIDALEEIVRETDDEIKNLEKRLGESHGQNKAVEDKLARAKEEKELLEEELAATKRLYQEAKADRDTLENTHGSIDTSFALELTKAIAIPEGKNQPEAGWNILVSSKKYNFVIIDIGADEGIKEGDKFSIYRDDRKIGEIEVTRICSRSFLAKVISILDGITVCTEDKIR